jgi:glycosyltransferase involved in cell wall biosynthesis
VLLTVARLAASERYKGVDSVLRSLPAITRRIPGLRYVVIGDGADRPRLEALAHELGISRHVEFRGWIETAMLARAYAECSVFVMPSSKEGFGIVFLEAAFFGKTSVGGRHGGTPEVIEDSVTGLLVDREDIYGLEAALTMLLGDPPRMRDMGLRAKKRLTERFTYPVFKDGVTDLLEETWQ